MTGRIDLPDGYYTVPAGKLVNAVTWLEMRARPQAIVAAPLGLVPVTQADGDLSRSLFKAIGTPWLWSRAYDVSGRPGEQRDAFPGDIFLALDGERRVGLVAFDGRGTKEVEITWFGLLPDSLGRGLGRRMMAAALDIAWAPAPERVWLHTCNFDHPAALGFYKACGFAPYATGFEIMDDPRLSGSLPRTAAPHVPLIERSD